MIKILVNQADHPVATFVFAHGAGAGQNSEFMQLMAQGISEHNINVVRFNFAYMQMADEFNKRRPPDKADKLIAHFQTILTETDQKLPTFIGGKSMGGRIASMLLQESTAKACVCMGYPFHPPGKPEKLRTEHLLTLTKPILIIQGERDTFGGKQEITTYGLPQQIKLTYLTDGDHSFKPRKSSGISLKDNLDLAIQKTCEFIKANI